MHSCLSSVMKRKTDVHANIWVDYQGNGDQLRVFSIIWHSLWDVDDLIPRECAHSHALRLMQLQVRIFIIKMRARVCLWCVCVCVCVCECVCVCVLVVCLELSWRVDKLRR
jgi:hypothetical protein